MLAFASTAAAVFAIILAFGPPNVLQWALAPGASLPPANCPSPLASGSIATIAGDGEVGSEGDGGRATEASISAGWGIAVDDGGNVYFSDQAARSVRRVGTDGTITTIAGPATGAGFVEPQGLAFDADGRLFVADIGADRIWRVEEDGSTAAVVGTGVSGTKGNDGPAIDAEIQAIGLAFGPDGDMYFDDLNNFRRVDAQGDIHAFAGSVEPGFSGDGASAEQAALGLSVSGVAVDPAGNVYLGDTGNRRIRKVDQAGTITTIAGGGSGGFGVDGPALDANLSNSPFGFAVDEDGTLYFSEWQTRAVRRVDSAGVLSTVVRFGTELGDCGPASEAWVRTPLGLAVHDGVLFIVDSGNHRIRMVVP